MLNSKNYVVTVFHLRLIIVTLKWNETLINSNEYPSSVMSMFYYILFDR